MAGLRDYLAQRRQKKEDDKMALGRQQVRDTAAALPATTGYATMRQGVAELMALRTPNPNASFGEIAHDPIVQQLGQLNLELRTPLRGISAEGRDNAFIVLIQDIAERHQMRKDKCDLLYVGSHTASAAEVVAIHDALPEDMQSDFLDAAVGRTCYLDDIATQHGMASLARVARPKTPGN